MDAFGPYQVISYLPTYCSFPTDSHMITPLSPLSSARVARPMRIQHPTLVNQTFSVTVLFTVELYEYAPAHDKSRSAASECGTKLLVLPGMNLPKTAKVWCCLQAQANHFKRQHMLPSSEP
jgi:hypothetical protein